jgi:hypothetical protein
MAVTITQQPTTPNVTGTNLVYTLNSPSSSNPQFRYITDISMYGPGGGYKTTIKTYPNLQGSGIVDIARELNDQLGYDLYWQITGSVDPQESLREFNIEFGEEYANSFNETVTQYPAQTSDYIAVFPGTVYKNEGSYNFNATPITSGRDILSNVPQPDYLLGENLLYVNKEDYHTITIYPNDGAFAAYVYDANNTLLTTQAFSTTNFFNTVGIGPQNLIDQGMSTSVFDTAARITIGNLGSPSFSIYLPNYPSYPCSDEYTRFAFINQYGFWDYYNVYNPLRKETRVDRSTYDKTFVDYSSNISSYNVSNRGTTQYRTEYEDMFTITTDYLPKPTADWLTEMFKSPEVYIQQNDDFVPINILNSDVTWNMNQFRQKLFQYEIEFKYANERQPR